MFYLFTILVLAASTVKPVLKLQSPRTLPSTETYAGQLHPCCKSRKSPEHMWLILLSLQNMLRHSSDVCVRRARGHSIPFSLILELLCYVI
ncbi:hypothetical protein DFJ58DRAFT_752842, partial [Suillus subalutaceus]|uniref:uncharacterized protein n=1 Tax=Suillus subalutaceus TaxID=48586 RepID=UPI001B883012